MPTEGKDARKSLNFQDGKEHPSLGSEKVESKVDWEKLKEKHAH